MKCLSAFAALILGLALSAPAMAQPKGEAADPETSDAPRKEGEYQGVKPGESEAKPKSSRRPTVTWVGFQARADGTSRVFMQLNREVEYEQTLDDKGALHVTVVGARFGSRNARRRIDTTFFDSAMASMSSRRARRSRARKGRAAQKAGLRFSVRFKTPADAQQAQISLQKESDGYHYLYLDFTPAKERPDTSAGADESRPTTGDDIAP